MYLSTHEELLQHDGEAVTCYIDRELVTYAEIAVEGERIFILQNSKPGAPAISTREYRYSWIISSGGDYYENNNRDCTKIKLVNKTISKINTSFMSTLKQTLKRLTRKEPAKTFIKVGFMDENEDITTKGREALEFILWEKYTEELKALADKITAEEEK